MVAGLVTHFCRFNPNPKLTNGHLMGAEVTGFGCPLPYGFHQPTPKFLAALDALQVQQDHKFHQQAQ